MCVAELKFMYLRETNYYGSELWYIALWTALPCSTHTHTHTHTHAHDVCIVHTWVLVDRKSGLSVFLLSTSLRTHLTFGAYTKRRRSVVDWRWKAS